MRLPRIGDRVRIDGFLGTFEIVRVDRNGLMVDLKHLGHPDSDYIEKEILTRELNYVDSPRPAVPIDGILPRHAHGNVHANVNGHAKESWPADGTNGKTKLSY